MFYTNTYFLFGVALAFIWLKRRRTGQLPLPPGPPKLPLIGSVLQMPRDFEWYAFHKWAKQYGSEIIHLDIMGKSVVVLDTAEAAFDLLGRRSALYSGRARNVMTNELMGWDFYLVTMDRGDEWRQHRRTFWQAFNAKAATQFRPVEIKATHRLLRRLLDNPENIIDELRLMAGDTIINIAYGLEVKDEDDPYLEAAEKGFRPFTVALIPSQFLVNFLPALKYLPEWFPGAGFLRNAKVWKMWTKRMLNLPFAAVQEKLQNREAVPSFAGRALQKIDPDEADAAEKEYVVKATAASMYAAGSDTTVAAISSCILGLLEHPEVVRKAQTQIDEVVGHGRLPTFEDYDQLPYVTAICKETLRWRVVVPIAVPHYLEVEDEYKGYRIPAGSTIIPNAWAMLLDPEVYPDPFSFKPDRFMTADGKLDTNVRDPDFAVWGFGRRICPGRHMAFSSVWIAVASLLAAFDVKKAIDEEGRTIELSHEYEPTIVMVPSPFKCSITPRSKESEELVKSTAYEGEMM